MQSHGVKTRQIKYVFLLVIFLLSSASFGSLLAFSSLSVQAATPKAGPTLSVDASSGQLPIDPDIYGITFFWSSDSSTLASEENYAKSVKLPLNRNGGDATSRYNWQLDSSNAGVDWYYTAGNGQDNPTPSGSVDAFVDVNRSLNTKSVITIPNIEYINGKSQYQCSYPTSEYPNENQSDYNPYVHPGGENCGSGKDTNGNEITDTNPTSHDIPNSPDIQKAWVQHFVQKYGAASGGGVQIYQMDNESHNWSYMHHDVHPQAVTESEIISQNIAYAAAVKAADPSAFVAGASEIQFGWYPEWGGDTNTTQYLQAMKDYEQQHGQRLIDSFDVHYPPSLDDIDHLTQLVAQTYPGTKVSFSEWNNGGDLAGALTTADDIGDFARDGITFASYWGLNDLQSPPAYVYQMYRNYDGNGNGFGDTYVSSSSADSTKKLSVYGALRSSDGALTIMVINQASSDSTSNLTLSGFTPSGTAHVYTYSNANLKAIVQQPDLSVNASGFTTTYPANSMTMIVIPPANPPTSTTTTPTSTTTAPTGTATPTPTTTPTPPSGGNSYTYYLPFLANNYAQSGGSFTSYLAFQNIGTAAANISLQYYDATGHSVSTPNSTCSSVARYGECVAPNPFTSNSRGSGVLTSNQPLNVIVSEATPYGGTAYAVPGTASNSLVAPLAINNSYGGFVTQLTVLNAGSSSVTATVQFYDSNGVLQSGATKNVAIQPNTNVILDQTASNSGLATGFYGWAQITAPMGSKLVGQVLEQNANNHFAAIANAQANPQATLYAPAIFNNALGGFVTGANIINPNATAISVTISYYDDSGNKYSAPAFNLAAHNIAAIYQQATSGNGLPTSGLPNAFAGAAVVTTTNGSAVMVVNEAGGATASGSARSGTYAASGTGLSSVGLPTVANGGSGFTTGATILNVSSQTVTGTIQYYNTDGTTVGTPKNFSVGPYSSSLVYQGDSLQGLSSGYYGTAVITKSNGPDNSLIVTTNAQSSNFFYSYTEPGQ